MTIDQQIENIRKQAEQHYGEDEAARNAYIVEKLIERLREYALRESRFVGLRVVDQGKQ